jgi:putative transposase
LEDARRKIDEWRQYYNEMRPHSALQWATPAEFALQARENALSAGKKSRDFLL